MLTYVDLHSLPLLVSLFFLLLLLLVSVRVTLWMPLRPVASVASNLGEDFGAIQIAVTYTDDYVLQG